MSYTDTTTLLDNVTADVAANPLYYDVGDADKFSLQLSCANHTSGNGVFTVEVTNDTDSSGVPQNWVTYNRLTTNVTNTNAQTDTRVASVTLSTNTSVFVFFPVGDHFKYLRVNVDVTTDGTYRAVVHRVISGS